MTYSRQAGQAPVQQDSDVFRSQNILVLWDQLVVNDTVERYSEACQVGSFRKFALYLRVYAETTPTTLQLVPQFLEPRSGLWHDMLQGIFASLFFEDTVHNTERQYVFHGDCAGREFRLKAVGVGTASSTYFILSAAVEFYN